MCELCDQDDDGHTTCPECGILICWNVVWPGDDYIKPAYATSGGDLLCWVCGREHDAAEEEEADEDNLDPDAEWMFPAPQEDGDNHD